MPISGKGYLCASVLLLAAAPLFGFSQQAYGQQYFAGKPAFRVPFVAEEVRSVDTTKFRNDSFRASSAAVEFYMPIEGRISSQYGVNRRTHRHQGLDIAAAPGTPIYAAASGRVVCADWKNGYGKMVLIEHADGRLTRYAHASQLLVSCGDMVEVGQEIALVGSTGHSTGPHLHFEILEDGSSLNPLDVLRPEMAADQAGSEVINPTQDFSPFIRASYREKR